MSYRFRPISTTLCALLCLLALSACSPTYNWRNTPASSAPYSAMLPGKPEVTTRHISIGNQTVSLTMTSATADQSVFAIGSADAGSQAGALSLLQDLKKSLVKNLPDAHVRLKEDVPERIRLDVQSGDVPGAPRREMQVLLLAKGPWIFQLMIVSEPDHVPTEQSQTFFSSFVAE